MDAVTFGSVTTILLLPGIFAAVRLMSDKPKSAGQLTEAHTARTTALIEAHTAAATARRQAQAAAEVEAEAQAAHARERRAALTLTERLQCLTGSQPMASLNVFGY